MPQVLVISKFNFGLIFKDAWLKAITPSNVVAGFRKAGIFPIYREQILSLIEMQSMHCQFVCICCLNVLYVLLAVNSNGNKRDTGSSDTGSATNDVNAEAVNAINDPLPNPRFTLAEEMRYSRRYKEGYGSLDPLYEEWLRLKINMP